MSFLFLVFDSYILAQIGVPGTFFEQTNALDGVLISYKGEITSDKPLFSVPRRVAVQNRYNSAPYTLVDTSESISAEQRAQRESGTLRSTTASSGSTTTTSSAPAGAWSSSSSSSTTGTAAPRDPAGTAPPTVLSLAAFGVHDKVLKGQPLEWIHPAFGLDAELVKQPGLDAALVKQPDWTKSFGVPGELGGVASFRAGGRGGTGGRSGTTTSEELYYAKEADIEGGDLEEVEEEAEVEALLLGLG